MIIESYVINPTVIIFYRLNKTEYSHVFLIYRHKKKIHTSLPTRFSIIDLDILLFIFVNNFSLILARIIVQDHKSSNRRTLLYMYAYNYKKARSYAVKWEFKLKLFLLSVTRDRKCHCWFPCHFKIRIRSACSLSAELHLALLYVLPFSLLTVSVFMVYTLCSLLFRRDSCTRPNTSSGSRQIGCGPRREGSLRDNRTRAIYLGRSEGRSQFTYSGPNADPE